MDFQEELQDNHSDSYIRHRGDIRNLGQDSEEGQERYLQAECQDEEERLHYHAGKGVVDGIGDAEEARSYRHGQQ